MTASDSRVPSTSALSDALDRLGLPGSCDGIFPVLGAGTISGPAWTVRYEPIGIQGGTVGDYIDDVPPGCVVILDNGGRMDCTVWGDILTTAAETRGLAGTVIHGVCRDVDTRTDGMAYGLFSRGVHMRTGKDRVRMAATQVAVSLGTVVVSPGDWVVGDANGVAVVPASRREEVIELARSIVHSESAIRDALASGSTLADARAKFGYHDLQRHSPNGD